MPNSIILPSGMCQKRNWKTGDNVSVIVSGRTLILSIEKIYPESTVTEETLEKDSLFSRI
jgi:antitoxin component of MazEF toxin-antitoxin module